MPTLLLDRLNYFALADETFDEDTGVLSAVLVKSQGTVLDRETERILTDGGLYAFQVLFTISIYFYGADNFEWNWANTHTVCIEKFQSQKLRISRLLN